MKHKIYGLAVIGDQAVSGSQTVDGDQSSGGNSTVTGNQTVGGRIINHQIPTGIVHIDDDYTASAGEFVHFDTYTKVIRVTLPGSPTDKDAIGFLDEGGWADAKNCIIDPGNKAIMGDTEDLAVDLKNVSFILEFDAANNDWRVK